MSNDLVQLNRRQLELDDLVNSIQLPPPSGAISIVATIAAVPIISGPSFVKVTLVIATGPFAPVAGSTAAFASTGYSQYALNVNGGTVAIGDEVLLTQIDGFLCFEA